MIRTTVPLFDDDTWKPYLPALAPLPEAFVRHVFRYPGELKACDTFSTVPRTLFELAWLAMRDARRDVSYFLVPAIRAQKTQHPEGLITPRWLRTKFAIFAEQERLPTTTVQGWLERGLLRTMAYSSLEPNSIAAIFVMRHLFVRGFRYWLPHKQKPAPWFYVWGIMPGEVAPPRIYPYPIPDGLPRNLLLFTQWNGARWFPGFVSVAGVGALAWARTKTFIGELFWDMTEEDMSTWDSSYVRSSSVKRRLEVIAPVIRREQQGFPDSEEYYTVVRTHEMADQLLKQIGEPILAAYMTHYFGEDKVPTKPFIPF